MDRGQESRRAGQDLKFNDKRFDDHLSNCFTLTRNREFRNKPSGGLWTSSYIKDGEYISAWHEFCVDNWGDITEPSIRTDDCPPRKADVNTRLSYLAILINVKRSARIYTINSNKDYQDLKARFPFTLEKKQDYYKHQIDWIECKKNFDVVWLTTEGEFFTRGSWSDTRDMELYGWDCEQSVMLNNVIESYKVIPSGVKQKSKQE